MTMSVSFRPQVTMAPTVIQQAQANECKEDLKVVDSELKDSQITDISAMTKRMQIESKLQDTKVAPVKYVEELKPIQPQDTAKVSETGSVNTPNSVTDVIKNFHRGIKPTNNERSQVLFNQMNQYAMSNRILHGLF